MADEYIIKVKADTKEAESSVSSLSSKFAGIGGALAGVAVGALSFQAIKAGLSAAIENAVEADDAVRSLNKALAISGQYSKEASDSFLSFAESLQKTTGVSDDLITKNAALLVSVGKLSGTALERATKAALDLSVGLGMDVASAFDVLAKASQGSVGALSRYGLEVNKSWTDSQKFSAALQFIEKQFGNLSKGSLNSFSGAMTNVNNSFGDFLEEVGNKIIKNKAVLVSINFLADAFYDMSESIKETNVSITPMVQGFITLGSVISQYLLAPLETVIRFMWGNFLNLPILLLGVASQITLILDKAFGSHTSAKIEGLRAKIAEMQDQIVKPILGEEEMFTTKLGKSLDDLNQKIDKTSEKLSVQLPNASNVAAKSIKKDTIDIGQSVNQGLAQTVAKGVATIVENVMAGKNAFSQLASAVGQVLGDLAIQVGTMLIAFGIGIAALMISLNPFAMIAAGVALVAVGAVLKSLSASKSGDTAGSSVNPANTGGVAGADSSYGSQFSESIDDRERMVAQTGVTINVQGNILDRRETGLELAEILNSAFDTNGTLVRANA